MIPRYTRPEFGDIWSDASRYQIWMEVELLACEAMASEGLVEPEVALQLRAMSFPIVPADVAEIERIEEETKHDVIAFLTFLERRWGPQARFLHMGMTSSDVLDTCFGVQLKRSGELILAGLNGLIAIVRQQAETHRHTLMMGRTHGIHAEPVTFGLVLGIWALELQRHRERLAAALPRVAVGKVSGAVGTFAHLPLQVEARVMRGLGLQAEPISNQIVQRDRAAEFFCVLAGLGSTIEKVAVNLRHLQRTEVGEVGEPFSKGQRGSSAMPHKKNPIGAENLSGLSRLLRSYALAALEDVPLWHERDISHSSVERVIGPDATILTDYALSRLRRIFENLRVDPQRMRQNIDLTQGVTFSQSVLLALVKSGLEREKAYEIVQRGALRAMEEHRHLKEILSADPMVTGRLEGEALERCFDLQPLLARVDEIFARAFGPSQ